MVYLVPEILKTVVGSLKLMMTAVIRSSTVDSELCNIFFYAGIDTMLPDSKQKPQFLWSFYVILVHQSLPDSEVW